MVNVMVVILLPQDEDFTILSHPSDSDSKQYEIQVATDCYILDWEQHYQYHELYSDKERIQLQTSLLPPVIQVFSSTFPSDSPPHSPPSLRTDNHIRCDSGINLQLSNEADIPEAMDACSPHE